MNLGLSNWIFAATTCGTSSYETHLQLHSWVVRFRQPDSVSPPCNPITTHTNVSGACNAIHINLMANLASDLHLCVCVGVVPLREQSATRSSTHPIVSIVAPWHAINLTHFFRFFFGFLFFFAACSLVERHVSSTLLNGTRCVLASIRKLNNKQQFQPSSNLALASIYGCSQAYDCTYYKCSA